MKTVDTLPKRRSLIVAAAALAAVGCASPDRRIEADKVKTFTLDEAPRGTMRVVLVPVDDLKLLTAYRESAAGWNTRLFDERFGRRLVANFAANGVPAQFRGASGLEIDSAQRNADWVLTIQLTRFSYTTRNGVQESDANYGIRVSLFRRGTSTPVLAYDDVMTRGFVGTHDNLPDRFTYSFFNLLRDRGRWPNDKAVALAA